MTKYASFFTIVCILGCSSTTMNDQNEYEGYGGEDSFEEGSQSSTQSTGGTDTSTGGVDVGTVDVGTGGTGNVVNPEQGCIPETCLEIGERISGVPGHAACGTAVDRCGNTVSCSTSCAKNEECGAHIWNDAAEGKVIAEEIPYEIINQFNETRYPNVCGESCIMAIELQYKICRMDGYTVPVICGQDTVPENCKNISNNVWCCNNLVYKQF